MTIAPPFLDSAPVNKLDAFSRYQPRVTRKICLSVEGREKDGKTHFALTAPGPIVYFNLDYGLDRVEPHVKFPDLDLRVVDVPSVAKNGHPDVIAEEALKVWEWLKVQHINALDSARTVVYDSFTEVWELIRLARFGKLTQVQSHHYGPINREFHEFIREYSKRSANLLLLHKVMPEFENKAEMERKGFSHIGFDVDDFVRVGREGNGPFYVEVINSGHNPAIKGKIFSEPSNTFPDIAMAMYPASQPLEWF
jgi:hypothetical protein